MTPLQARPLPDRFQVAFSFAGEQRELVRAIALAVEARLGEGAVFLDEWFEYYLAGPDADLKLQAIYGEGSELAVLCVSARYGSKAWTLTEHEAIRARLMRARASADQRDRDAILPLRVGDGDMDGVQFNTIAPDVRDRAPDAVADLIVARLALIAPRVQSASGSPRQPSPPQEGAVSQRAMPAQPLSRCSRPDIQSHADALDAAHAELERRLSSGQDASEVRERILELRRRIREGGRLRAGDLLLDGRYKLLEQLKQGGFGTIYRAYDRRRHDLVAIKVLHGQYGDDRTRVERFFRGARKMGELAHPGIVRVIEPKLTDEGHHFFVMEYLPGGDLRDAVHANPLPPHQALDLIATLGEALAFAHDGGIIHRDVKPANIVLDVRFQPKLTDFDLVRACDTTGGTRSGLMGTLGYAAPEAMQQAQDADVRADVYGLGMTAVFALQGADPLPFEVWRDPAAYVGRLELPLPVQAVLQQAIALTPEERFDSVRGFCDALSEARRSTRSVAAEGGMRPGQRARTRDSAADLSEGPTPLRDAFLDGSGHGPAMIWLPGGTFIMGAPRRFEDDRAYPPHEVRLGPFAAGQYPVTLGEFRRFVASTGYRTEAELGGGAWVENRGDSGTKSDASWRNPYIAQNEQHPVVCVSWNDAQAYCRWLTAQTGHAYCLLTEAQWEYACRAGTATPYSFDDDAKGAAAYIWCSRNSEGRTHPVGAKAPNPWRLHDMHGHCWEWCQDWYGDYSAEPQTDPSGPESGAHRVARGGAWDGEARNARSSVRGMFLPSYRYAGLGFRLARLGGFGGGQDARCFGGAGEGPEPIAGLRDRLADGSQGPAMVWLTGGIFTMGQDKSPYRHEGPAHPVRVDAFSMGQYPVTFAEYDRFCEAIGRDKPSDRGLGRADRPVINVSWEDALAYCAWLSKETGESYRLPTEAEWEYACRAGTESPWFCGDDEIALDDSAWYGTNSDRQTHPVGQKDPNPWQLYDMHGNVLEWCQDWYSEHGYEQFQNQSDERATVDYSCTHLRSEVESPSVPDQARLNPPGPESGSGRVIRGGSWINEAVLCRSASRDWAVPSVRYNNLGFRLARAGPWRSHPLSLRPI